MIDLAIKYNIGDLVVARASLADTPDVGTVTAFKSGGTYIDEYERVKPFYLAEVKFWSDPDAVHIYWNYELAHANL